MNMHYVRASNAIVGRAVYFVAQTVCHCPVKWSHQFNAAVLLYLHSSHSRHQTMHWGLNGCSSWAHCKRSSQRQCLVHAGGLFSAIWVSDSPMVLCKVGRVFSVQWGLTKILENIALHCSAMNCASAEVFSVQYGSTKIFQCSRLCKVFSVQPGGWSDTIGLHYLACNPFCMAEI